MCSVQTALVPWHPCDLGGNLDLDEVGVTHVTWVPCPPLISSFPTPSALRMAKRVAISLHRRIATWRCPTIYVPPRQVAPPSVAAANSDMAQPSVIHIPTHTTPYEFSSEDGGFVLALCAASSTIWRSSSWMRLSSLAVSCLFPDLGGRGPMVLRGSVYGGGAVMLLAAVTLLALLTLRWSVVPI